MVSFVAFTELLRRLSAPGLGARGVLVPPEGVATPEVARADGGLPMEDPGRPEVGRFAALPVGLGDVALVPFPEKRTQQTTNRWASL
eukprot:9501901-Pyramimonas_sp.AAC.1